MDYMCVVPKVQCQRYTILSVKVRIYSSKGDQNMHTISSIITTALEFGDVAI